MKATLKDGTVLEGTPEEIKEFLKDKEDNGFKITPAPAIIPQEPSINEPFSNAIPCEGCDIYERTQKGEVVVDDRCSFCSKNPNKLTCISGGPTDTKVTLNQEVKEEKKVIKTIPIKKPEPKKIDKGLQDVKLPDYMSPNFRGFN